jgi:hypothetical protein
MIMRPISDPAETMDPGDVSGSVQPVNEIVYLHPFG